ncbi:MAG: ATP-binding protein [Bacilli bacterium]|jgi:energy-coupling factor transporter ATP-binding protein EcfA2|nr:ATP-binding protein [Bacilli bacterium]
MNFIDGIVRLQKLSLHNIKNVVGGSISFPSKDKPESLAENADVIGVYGQNGSGKTALVESLRILKAMLSGSPVNGNVANDIRQGQEKAAMSFDFEFLVHSGDRQFCVIYSFSLIEGPKDQVTSRKIIKVGYERLKIKKLHVLKDNLTTVFDTELNEEEEREIAFKPVASLSLISKGKARSLAQDLLFARHDADEAGQSFIFSSKAISLFEAGDIDQDYLSVILSLRRYGTTDLLVLDTEECNQFFMVVNLRVKNEEKTKSGLIPVGFQTNQLAMPLFEDLQQWLPNVNVILGHLVPGVQIGIENVFPITMIDPNGNPIKGKQFQMVSIRDGIKIPLQYESGGIRKIVACLGALIAAYNNESVLAVIDGFDSNIFEYLFGEIVSVFSDSGTGQFIFTSHNLRPLEVLGNHGIYLTTTDPNDRYAEYPYTKDTVNFRSKYLRDIKLDSKLTTSSNTREFYSPTNEDDIRHAFTLAWGEK